MQQQSGRRRCLALASEGATARYAQPDGEPAAGLCATWAPQGWHVRPPQLPLLPKLSLSLPCLVCLFQREGHRGGSQAGLDSSLLPPLPR